MTRCIIVFLFFMMPFSCLGQPLAHGRLGLSPSLHWIGDITGATTVYYTNDASVHQDAGPWSANAIYDFFDDGSTLCHQPWTPRPSSGAIAPPSATICAGSYIGSGSTDANGQFNQHKTAGPSRRWDIWNAFNQIPIDLQVVDATGNVTVTTAQSSWHPITSSSSATFIIGLPQQASCLVRQQAYRLSPGGPGNGSSWATVACGWGPQFGGAVAYQWPNLTGQPQGIWGQEGEDVFWSANNAVGMGGTLTADYTSIDNVGLQQVWEVYISPVMSGAASNTYFGRNVATRIMHIRFMG